MISQHPRPEGVAMIQGTRALHSVDFQPATGGMRSCQLSCCCLECLSGREEDCLNVAWVREWKEEQLQQTTAEGTAVAGQEDEDEEEGQQFGMDTTVGLMREGSWAAVHCDCLAPRLSVASRPGRSSRAHDLYGIVRLDQRPFTVTAEDQDCEQVPTLTSSGSFILPGDMVFSGRQVRVSTAMAHGGTIRLDLDPQSEPVCWFLSSSVIMAAVEVKAVKAGQHILPEHVHEHILDLAARQDGDQEGLDFD